MHDIVTLEVMEGLNKLCANPTNLVHARTHFLVELQETPMNCILDH